MKQSVISYRIKVYGIVQGVGFRPFVYKLAKSLDLRGWIYNSIGSVDILIQGEEENIKKFIDILKNSPPPLSRIEKIHIDIIEDEKSYDDFSIIESKEDIGFNFISPDIAICDDCLREMRDPKDRRYSYPFINCTNCGPRYTIIEDLPYDRDKTSMKIFEMCEECKKEYHDPLSRRFHAQPISCFNCGPNIWIDGLKSDNIFKDISDFLKENKIIAIKGIGGFHLMCSAVSDVAVLKLRERKRRKFKPFALMMRDLDMIEEYCFLNDIERSILTSKERPIVLLRIKDLKDISPYVAPNNEFLGVMLPYAPYHYLIFDYFDKPLIMTSGNVTDEPIVKDNEESKKELKNIADIFVFHNRNIIHRVDDSVVFVENNQLNFVRRARGYAPDPIKVPIKVRPVLALGGELKNTFALGKEEYIFISPHIGDLKDKKTLEVYEETINEFIRLFRIEPEILVHDLHPQYLSTEFAQRFEKFMEVIPLQHHKAHVYSLLLDNNITEDIIGFSFDGTGYGEDGKIWGGEVFIGNLDKIERIAHFKYFPIAGGDYSIENPIRIALSYITKYIPSEINSLFPHIDFLEKELIKKLIRDEVGIFYTSSCGRIFDLVSALLGIREKIDYEGQAAIELETYAWKKEDNEFYPFEIVKKDLYEIDILPTIEKIIEEKNYFDRSIVARRFHNTIAKVILNMAEMFREKFNIRSVGFTGGVFQNRLLINLVVPALEKKGFKVYLHRRVPTNDGGISLGQVIMARE